MGVAPEYVLLFAYMPLQRMPGQPGRAILKEPAHVLPFERGIDGKGIQTTHLPRNAKTFQERGVDRVCRSETKSGDDPWHRKPPFVGL
jgi:hypothetical protein